MGRSWLIDGALAGVILVAELASLAVVPGPRTIDTFGVFLLVAATLPLVARRRAPMTVLAVHLALAIPYHANEYPHESIIPATILALYTVARHGTWLRTALVVVAVTTFGVLGILMSPEGNENVGLEAFGALGWIVMACVAGQAARLQQAYIAEVLDRAERAERSRDEEARRQVAEERLRMARDLHDLLAHTITVIQVQAGVASHLLTEKRTDRATVITALDTISDACADARAELKATVEVLRAPKGEPRGPLPSLARLSPLAEPAEAAGTAVEFTVEGTVRALPPTVEMVGYRIVQEALTNIAKHSDASRAEVALDYGSDRLVVRIADNGRGGTESALDGSGFGIRGMIERAEAIGGQLDIGSTTKGFTITAALPVPRVVENIGSTA